MTEGSIRSATDRFMKIAAIRKHSDKILIVAAFDVEKISPFELKRLDFLFRIHDRSFEHSSILLLLMWNTDNKAIEVDSDDRDSEMSGESARMFLEKKFLTREWSRGGHQVNGAALVGRLSDFFHCQGCKDESLRTGHSPLDSCLSAVPPDPHPSPWPPVNHPTFLVGIFVDFFLMPIPWRQYLRLVVIRIRMYFAERGMRRLLQ